MYSFYTFTNFLIGCCLASHACVFYQRYTTQNFILTRSRCDNCHFELSLLDELPLISFLLLKGHCKYCKTKIPPELFFFELLGGFAFCLIDFSSKAGLLTGILLFSLFLVAIADYQQKEFDLPLIFPAFLVILIDNQIPCFQLIDWLSLLLLILVFSWNIFKQNMGSGDLLIYLIIALYFTPSITNLVLLFASILLILIYLIDTRATNYHYPFIPYILIGLIITQFL